MLLQHSSILDFFFCTVHLTQVFVKPLKVFLSISGGAYEVKEPHPRADERLMAVSKNVMSPQEPAAEGVHRRSAVFQVARENCEETSKSEFSGFTNTCFELVGIPNSKSVNYGF